MPVPQHQITSASTPDGLPEPKPRTRPRQQGQKLQQLLRADIVAGRIPAGSRLKVTDIIARYNTSTNPAREALHALEGEGLVVLTPNRGARVRSIDATFVTSIFDIRRLIEPYIVRWFAEYATAEDRRLLGEIHAECQKAADTGDLTKFHKHNRDFHDFIISRHFNTEAARIMRTQNAWLRLLTSEYPPTLAQMKRSSAEHCDLLAAMEDFDADRAARIVLQHSEQSQAALMGRMQRSRYQP